MPDLSVKVDRHDIVVSKPSNGFSVTYRRQGRILEAVEPMRIDPSAEELIFRVRAWKAAFAKGAIARLALLSPDYQSLESNVSVIRHRRSDDLKPVGSAGATNDSRLDQKAEVDRGSIWRRHRRHAAGDRLPSRLHQIRG